MTKLFMTQGPAIVYRPAYGSQTYTNEHEYTTSDGLKWGSKKMAEYWVKHTLDVDEMIAMTKARHGGKLPVPYGGNVE
jgi:hypothetical protein